MLRFIEIEDPETGIEYNFNTSHVTVYQSFSHSIITSSHISIHLMLRFIEVAIPALDPITEFQYISCYGLSRTSLTVSLLFQNFNTSHVTVYLMILSHFYLGIFHHFLYFTSFQHFLPADYKI